MRTVDISVMAVPTDEEIWLQEEIENQQIQLIAGM